MKLANPLVHPALLIPEVLNNIISNLPPSSQAKVARVCCLWWKTAIDLLWHTLDDWHNLFRIAGSLHTAKRREGELIGVGPVQLVSATAHLSSDF